MLCEGSRVGLDLCVDAIPVPATPGRENLGLWMRAFFSYGFLLTVAPEKAGDLCGMFSARKLEADVIGSFIEGSCVSLTDAAGGRALLRDWKEASFTGYRRQDGDPK